MWTSLPGTHVRSKRQSSLLGRDNALNFWTCLQAGNAILQQCQALVDQLALFSSNEDADDLATAGSVLCAAMIDVSHFMPICFQCIGWFDLCCVVCRPEVHANSSYAR